MRANQITDKTKVVEYDSLHEFYEYLIHTPFNDAFRWAKHFSVDGDYYFTKREILVRQLSCLRMAGQIWQTSWFKNSK